MTNETTNGYVYRKIKRTSQISGVGELVKSWSDDDRIKAVEVRVDKNNWYVVGRLYEPSNWDYGLEGKGKEM